MPTTSPLRERLEALGYDEPVFVTINGGTTVAWIRPQLLSCDLCFAPVQSLENGIEQYYVYDDYETAVVELALLTTRAAGEEPERWVRHKPSNRRRLNGDPAHESVRL